MEKLSSRKIVQKLLLFVSVCVFSSIQLDGSGFYAVIIMKFFCHILIIDNNTSTGLLAWYEYHLTWAGVPRIVREFRNKVKS